MGYKIRFNSYQELTTFIDYAQDLWLWGTRKFELVSSSGSIMNIDTRNYATGNTSGYVDFSTLRPYINQYYVNNGSEPIILDIKLKCPESFLASADPNKYYRAFYINFYSGRNNHYLNLSYDENGIELVTGPFKVFVAYIDNIYKKWAAYYKYEYSE